VNLWEVIARERIRDTLARYNWSGDSLRLDDMAESFCEDGELQLRGEEPVRGREAIVAFIGGVGGVGNHGETSSRPRIVRHILTNTRFLELTPERARVASYFTVVTEIGLDHYGRYRDTFVAMGDEWLIRHRFISTDWAAPNSTMAPQTRS
jgi:hypothetical protein